MPSNPRAEEVFEAIRTRRAVRTATSSRPIGVPRTKQLFFVGRNISAARACEWGLVNEVVAESEVADRGVALAAEIAANAPLSQTGNKRVIRELLDADMHLDPDVERELIELRQACFHSDDFFEGVRSFAEKRKPAWQGR